MHMNLLRINSFSDIVLESIFGISVVFVALLLLVLSFYITGKLSRHSFKRKHKIEGGNSTIAIEEREISSDEIAVISLALYQFLNDLHDEESNVITIKRIERRYSPWSSKIYGMTNLNR